MLAEDKVLDCSGLSCPMPVVKTSRAIKEVAVGQVLKMIATDSGAPADMDAWARQTGNQLLGSFNQDGKYIFYIQRTK